jgi:hypothetical protein
MHGDNLMSNESNAEYTMRNTAPSPALKSLDKLTGTWILSGDAVGRISYEWMEGGFFLIQRVDIEQGGHTIKGMEVIGHERLFGATEESEDIKSRFYDSEGNTLDYVYEMNGNTLTIWGGEKGSPAYCTTHISDDGNSVSGAWVWPGGGYSYSGTRVD